MILREQEPDVRGNLLALPASVERVDRLLSEVELTEHEWRGWVADLKSHPTLMADLALKLTIEHPDKAEKMAQTLAKGDGALASHVAERIPAVSQIPRQDTPVQSQLASNRFASGLSSPEKASPFSHARLADKRKESIRPAAFAARSSEAPPFARIAPLNALGETLAYTSAPFSSLDSLFNESLEVWLLATDKLAQKSAFPPVPFALSAERLSELLRLWDHRCQSSGFAGTALVVDLSRLHFGLSPTARLRRWGWAQLPALAGLPGVLAVDPRSLALFMWALTGHSDSTDDTLLVLIDAARLDSSQDVDLAFAAFETNPVDRLKWTLDLILNSSPGADQALLLLAGKADAPPSSAGEICLRVRDHTALLLAGNRWNALGSHAADRGVERRQTLAALPLPPSQRHSLAPLLSRTREYLQREFIFDTLDQALRAARAGQEQLAAALAGAVLLEYGVRMTHLEDSATHPEYVMQAIRQGSEQIASHLSSQVLRNQLHLDSALLAARYYQAAPQYRRDTTPLLLAALDRVEGNRTLVNCLRAAFDPTYTPVPATGDNPESAEPFFARQILRLHQLLPCSFPLSSARTSKGKS